MTRYLIIAAVLAIMILPYTQPALRTAEAGDRQDIESLIQTFFSGLSSGDTDTVLSCLTEPMLSLRKGSLLNNPNYPNLLRKFYKNSKIDIGGLKVIDDYTMVVSVTITKSNKQARNTSFLCKKDNGLWKIADELRSNL